MPTCPASLAQAWPSSSVSPLPCTQGAGKTEAGLLELIRQQASAPPLRRTLFHKISSRGAPGSLWAVVGLEGRLDRAGRPSHCSQPCPFHPTQTSCGSACPSRRSAAGYEGCGGGSRPADPESLPEQREEGMGAGRYLCSRATPPRGRQGVSGVNPAFFLQFL